MRKIFSFIVITHFDFENVWIDGIVWLSLVSGAHGLDHRHHEGRLRSPHLLHPAQVQQVTVIPVRSVSSQCDCRRCLFLCTSLMVLVAFASLSIYTLLVDSDWLSADLTTKMNFIPMSPPICSDFWTALWLLVGCHLNWGWPSLQMYIIFRLLVKPQERVQE